MHEFIDSSDDVIALQVSQKITGNDLQVIMDRLDDVMARHDKVHVFVETQSIIHGASNAAVWQAQLFRQGCGRGGSGLGPRRHPPGKRAPAQYKVSHLHAGGARRSPCMGHWRYPLTLINRGRPRTRNTAGMR